MIEGIRKFFAANLAPAAASAPDRRLEIATCALLLEAAQADDDFSSGERESVRAILRERFSLADPDVQELIALAEAERARSTGLYSFTRLIADAYDDAGKRAVLELLWRVIYSDGRLEEREDALVHRLAYLLGVPHAELIAIKLRVKRQDGTPGDAGPA